MKYAFMAKHRDTFPIGLMCQVLAVGKSGFYAWLKRPESPRVQENRRFVEAIKVVHHDSRHTYGRPRVHADLKALGYQTPVEFEQRTTAA